MWKEVIDKLQFRVYHSWFEEQQIWLLFKCMPVAFAVYSWSEQLSDELTVFAVQFQKHKKTRDYQLVYLVPWPNL